MAKKPPANIGDAGSIPVAGTSPGEGPGSSLQHSCPGSLMDRGDWSASVHGVSESDTTE